jgi:hypothetical protein
LTETLAALKPLHARLDAVADELQRAYDDQSGEWRTDNIFTFGWIDSRGKLY